jgi:iron-sulfur cluster insertion protein|nr:iron-sulfur cluster insertion protein ErpA [Oxalobacteraceae bacterium]
MIQVTSQAVGKIRELMTHESQPQTVLRVFVTGGGCSGLQYGFTFDQETTQEDFEIHCGVPMVVDAMSMQYLQGATIDYQDDVAGSAFVIQNPNANTTCGCGSSFSI